MAEILHFPTDIKAPRQRRGFLLSGVLEKNFNPKPGPAQEVISTGALRS